MTAIEILFEIVVNLFEGWLYCFAIHKKFTLRSDIGKRTVWTAMAATIVAVAAFYSVYIWVELPFTDTVVWIFPAVYALVLYEENWAVKTTWVICYAALCLSVIEMVTAFMITVGDLGWDEILAPSLSRLLFVVVCNGLMFAVLFAASKIPIGQSRLSLFSLTVFTVINIAIIVVLEMLFQLITQQLAPEGMLMMTVYGLLGIEVGVFLLFQVMSFYAEKKYELETEAKLNTLKEEHIEEIRTMYGQIQDYRHDLKHHFAALEEMIHKGQIQESQLYLNGIQDLSFESRILTGSIAVDAILSLKQAQMQQHGIRFEFQKYPVQSVRLSDVDFCTLLGNLLDNAIEAELRMTDDPMEKVISLSFSRTYNMFLVRCINTCDPKQIHRRGNDFLSSKRDRRIGIGVPRIRQIVDQAGGHCIFRAEKGHMIVDIMIPVKSETEND